MSRISRRRLAQLTLLAGIAAGSIRRGVAPARRPFGARFAGRIEDLGKTVTESAPQVALLDGNAIVAARQQFLSGEGDQAQGFAELRSAADRALTDGPFSVTAKSSTLPGVDAHEYVSLAIYYWPDPTTADGLPYVRRDGHVNPDARTDAYDATTFLRMVNDVNLLATAYAILGEERYADRAALLLRTWFLDDTTRMNPDLRYSQIIPGRPIPKTGSGIIEGMPLLSIPDSAGLLAGSAAWSADDQGGLQSWFAQLLTWLQQSDPGIAQSKEPNNHGSWYDAQVAGYALFTGQTALAAEVIADDGPQRIATQIEPDGGQPLELARTRPFHYSVFNLDALAVLATLGEPLGVDLWSYQTDDGRGIRSALDFLLPYATGAAAWPYPDLESMPPAYLAWVLNRAAAAYPDGSYGNALNEIFPPATALQGLGLSIGEWLTDRRLSPPAATSYSAAPPPSIQAAAAAFAGRHRLS